MDKKKNRILVIYTGGTVAMEGQPLRPRPLYDLRNNIPELDKLPYDVTWKKFYHHGNLIDSSNVNREFINNLAQELGENHKSFDSFIVIIGTDTMAPTSASISYLLEGFGKPVIFTGSMYSSFEKENDAKNNLLNSFHLAAKTGVDIPKINETVICFNNKFFRAVCSQKYSANNIDAFKTPEQELLGEINGEKITINEKELMSDSSGENKLTINKIKDDLTVRQLFISPMSDKVFEQIVKTNIEHSDALLVCGIQLKQGDRKFDIMQKHLPKDMPVFYVNSNDAPDPNWIKNNRITLFQQAIAKIHYVLSRIKDLSEIRKLYEGNLRGEGDCPIIHESDILMENNLEIGFETRREGKNY